MLDDIRPIDEYYRKKVIFGIIFTILLIISTIPPILVGSLGPTDQTPSSNSERLEGSLIVSGSMMGGMLLLQYYPIHRVVFYRIPNRRSTGGVALAFVLLTLFAMMISVVNIAWSAIRISAPGTGTILKNITTAYSIIGIVASVIGAVIDFGCIIVYVGRY